MADSDELSRRYDTELLNFGMHRESGWAKVLESGYPRPTLQGLDLWIISFPKEELGLSDHLDLVVVGKYDALHNAKTST